MNPLLQEAIAGEPVLVTLGSGTYPLAYPMQGVILYKAETARLDRARSKDKDKLTRGEKLDLRTRRQKLLQEADTLRPAKNQDWQPEKFLEFDQLMEEASTLKISLDEDAGAGDSLYDMHNWRKISPTDDPERVVLALWVGTHTFVPSKTPGKPDEYTEQIPRQNLGGLIHLGNGGDLTLAISKALSAHLISTPETKEVEDPNVQTPAIALMDPPVVIVPPTVMLQPFVTGEPTPPERIEERREKRTNEYRTLKPIK